MTIEDADILARDFGERLGEAQKRQDAEPYKGEWPFFYLTAGTIIGAARILSVVGKKSLGDISDRMIFIITTSFLSKIMSYEHHPVLIELLKFLNYLSNAGMKVTKEENDYNTHKAMLCLKESAELVLNESTIEEKGFVEEITRDCIRRLLSISLN